MSRFAHNDKSINLIHERFMDWIMIGFMVLYLFGKLIRVYVDFNWAIPSGNVAFTPTTWLVNYAGGFVRRGLQGHILLWLHNVCGVEPQYVIVVASITLYFFLLTFFIRQFVKRDCCWWIVPLTLFLGGLEIDRTDGLALSLAVGAVYFYGNVQNTVLRWFLANVMGVCAILVHEITFLLVPPMMFVLVLRGRCNNFARAMAAILPMAIAFLLVFYCSGTAETVVAIKNSWRDVLGAYWSNSDFAGVSSIGWTIQSVFGEWVKCFWESHSAGCPDIVWFILMICAAYILACNAPSFMRMRAVDDSRQITLGSILIFQLLMIVPIFFVFFDSSRLVAYWFVSSFLWFFVVPASHFQESIPSCFFKLSRSVHVGVGRIYRFFSAKIAQYVLIAMLLCFGVPSVGMNIFYAAGRSVVGTYITFAFSRVFVSHGLLSNPGEGRPACEVFAR